MAHRLLYDFVADLTRVVDFPEPIVEFGSMQVEEGQPNDLRPLFEGRAFIGTDFRDGPGVDRVEDLRALCFTDGEIGTALCLDTLEHCADPLTACREMHRVLADGGLCVISSVMLIGIHAYPSDYWRFTPEGLRTLLANFEDSDVAAMGSPEHPFFVFGAARKGRALGVDLAQLPAIASAQRDWERAEGKVRIGPFRLSLRELARTLRNELGRAVRARTIARLGAERRRQAGMGLGAPSASTHSRRSRS